MSDLSLHRLVVQGPRRDVAKFRRAATANRTVHSEGLLFSLRRLMSILPAGTPLDQDLLEGHLHDLVVEPTTTVEHGMVEATYKFQLEWDDLEAFIIQISTVFPSLCFILGTVEPSVDRQASCLILSGSIQRWDLPESVKEQVLANVPEETDDSANDAHDEIFWALVEADWAMMDAVVDHWADTAKQKLATMAADTHTNTDLIDGDSGLTHFDSASRAGMPPG